MLIITTLFLIAVFLAAELYRFKRRITGLIRDIRFLDDDPTGLMGARIQVITPENGEITAFISSCQMCASPISIGAKVLLIPGPNGYVMKSPWTYRRSRGACPKGMAI
jgi:hypothetical protein